MSSILCELKLNQGYGVLQFYSRNQVQSPDYSQRKRIGSPHMIKCPHNVMTRCPDPILAFSFSFQYFEKKPKRKELLEHHNILQCALYVHLPWGLWNFGSGVSGSLAIAH
jgi:hypothetical protein